MVGRERKEPKGRERKGREGVREREYKPFHVILQYEINIVEKL